MSLGRRRFGQALACGGALALLGGHGLARGAATIGAEFVAPRYRPSAEGDERDLWSVLDRSERALAESRFVLGGDLAAWCHDVACRLLPSHCADLRAYVVRSPRVDAGIAPNGMMRVSTGLLLRCRDEAQLAAIVGHALGHFLRRHALDRWRATRATVDWGSFFALTLAVEGADAVEALGRAPTATAYAFTPAQERDADAIGLRLMTDAGYAPAAAPEIWAQLVAEAGAAPADGDPMLLLANHPDAPARISRLSELARAAGGGARERQRERYRTHLAPLRPTLLGDELLLHRYERSLALVDLLAADAPDDGVVWFARGEVHRLRAGAGDAARALAAYDRALGARGAPPETFRSLGLVRLHAGARAQAAQAFAEYLRRRPDAPDRDAVRGLIGQ